MPPKVYLDAPAARRLPRDARARRRAGDAQVGHVASPATRARGLPAVIGRGLLSRREDGEPLALLDARAVTALRTGAVAAVATQALAREDARTVGVVGCGLHGAWAARCLAAAGYGPGVCFDPRRGGRRRARRRAGLGAGPREEALAARRRLLRHARARAGRRRRRPAPGPAPEHARRRRPGQGRGDGRRGRRAATLFCDEWAQAVARRRADRRRRGGPRHARRGHATSARCSPARRPGAAGPDAVTLFDSTGLAIQDLAVAGRRAGGAARRAASTAPSRLALGAPAPASRGAR